MHRRQRAQHASARMVAIRQLLEWAYTCLKRFSSLMSIKRMDLKQPPNPGQAVPRWRTHDEGQERRGAFVSIDSLLYCFLSSVRQL